MLVLSRKAQQEIVIGDSIRITVLQVRGNTVRLGIEAPRSMPVRRGELEARPAGDTPMTEVTFSLAEAVDDEHGLGNVGDILAFPASDGGFADFSQPGNGDRVSRIRKLLDRIRKGDSCESGR